MSSIESDVQAPRWRAGLLREAAAMRAWGRWLLLPSLLMWPLWILSFGTLEAQLFVTVACALPWLFAIAYGGLGVAIEFVRGPRRRPQPRRWRGRWLALASIAVWGLVLSVRPDVRLWLWRNERELERVVAQARTAPAPVQRARIEGYTVTVVGPTRAVLFHVGDGEQGVAYDPERTLRDGRYTDLGLVGVRALRGPWRIWTNSD